MWYAQDDGDILAVTWNDTPGHGQGEPLEGPWDPEDDLDWNGHALTLENGELTASTVRNEYGGTLNVNWNESGAPSLNCTISGGHAAAVCVTINETNGIPVVNFPSVLGRNALTLNWPVDQSNAITLLGSEHSEPSVRVNTNMLGHAEFLIYPSYAGPALEVLSGIALVSYIMGDSLTGIGAKVSGGLLLHTGPAIDTLIYDAVLLAGGEAAMLPGADVYLVVNESGVLRRYGQCPLASNVWTGVNFAGTTGSKRASSIANCSAGNVKDGVTIDDVAGTYPTTETSKAEQLAADQAEVNNNKAKIWNGEMVLQGSDPGVMRASHIENCEPGNVKKTVVIDDVAGEYDPIPEAFDTIMEVALDTYGLVDAIQVVDGRVGVNSLAAGLDVYQADIQFTRDQLGRRDEWTVNWFRNSEPVTEGITEATLQVVDRNTGSDLIAETAMAPVGDTGALKYDETVKRLAIGGVALAVARAVISEQERVARRTIGRSS